ncbi:GNAT family N-acetyltransferase [Actinophytocola glycyrrhizae]|uniref:GNAT family N-acetyltransferase n=1 Tax=Actinophytocola glycyrrhizae TaxID=2044873 RepID=A0ABV9RVZ4_9PSEU
MGTIRLTGDDWRLLRDLRLAALADAPHAFGSSLAGEEGLGEADWRRRLAGGLWTVVSPDGVPAGLVGAYVREPDTPMLVSMWVRPGARGLGIGNLLITDVLRWAAENRWSRVVLRVADGNDAARKLFLRHGFEPTGEREPLASDPGVGTELLARVV